MQTFRKYLKGENKMPLTITEPYHYHNFQIFLFEPVGEGSGTHSCYATASTCDF
jgi:hypothetical protein